LEDSNSKRNTTPSRQQTQPTNTVNPGQQEDEDDDPAVVEEAKRRLGRNA
jgi:hypothetical protein